MEPGLMHCGTYRNCAMGFSWTVTLLNGHSTNGAEIQCEMSVECKMTWQSKSITVDDLIQQEFASKQLILYSLVSIDNPISAVAWLQIKPELCKRCLQASKYIFVFIKCNRTSQDIDTVLILKKIWPLPKPFWIATKNISQPPFEISRQNLVC